MIDRLRDARDLHFSGRGGLSYIYIYIRIHIYADDHTVVFNIICAYKSIYNCIYTYAFRNIVLPKRIILHNTSYYIIPRCVHIYMYNVRKIHKIYNLRMFSKYYIHNNSKNMKFYWLNAIISR